MYCSCKDASAEGGIWLTQAIGHVDARPVEEARVSVQNRVRLPAIDRMRGLVILLMALDHVRDFFNADALHFDPTDLTRTYPALFLIRFVTHVCAPTFVLLASSAFLLGAKLGDRRVLAHFLLTRGAWLIVLDLLIVSPVLILEPGWFDLGVLWAIGFDVILLAGLVFLPPHAVLIAGLLIVFGHNLLDPTHASEFGSLGPLWTLLF